MTNMSTPYELTGRSEQKQRTSAALVSAARQLVASGVTPTVEQAATAAGISRTAAYRYFPNQRALLMAAHPETGTSSMLPADPPGDPAARLDLVVRAFTQLVVETEAQQRTMLRLSLEADPVERAALPLRQGRAIGWIEEALVPLGDQLPDPARHQLVLAIRSAIGIEALAWLTDVAKLNRAEAVDLMSWSAQALLQAALTWQPPARRRAV
jgi:AcrR family transcriptional regulator